MSEYLQIQINGEIILPASICVAANLQEGDLLEVIVEEDRSIHLIPQSAETRKMVEQAQFRRHQLGIETQTTLITDVHTGLGSTNLNEFGGVKIAPILRHKK